MVRYNWLQKRDLTKQQLSAASYQVTSYQLRQPLLDLAGLWRSEGNLCWESARVNSEAWCKPGVRGGAVGKRFGKSFAKEFPQEDGAGLTIED